MFTQPVSSPPTGPRASPSVTASRPSRLRGLSYLRNYTHNHLLSRDSHSGVGGNNSNTTTRSPSPGRTNGNLTRSVSYTPTTTTTITAGDNAYGTLGSGNRLTLVSSTPDRETSRKAPVAAAETSLPTVTSTGESSRAAEVRNIRQQGESSEVDTSSMTRVRASTNGDASVEGLPSIRFSAYFDPRSTRPSLSFPPITRTLPTGSESVRVGRYSERDSQSMANLPGNQPSAAPVGFKSKVVSRRHCEFWQEDGKWYIKDVKSSSGTFLNHIRLSGPSQESKAFPINDGDIVQLGIDFKGGEEMIFRCVKMRVELNRNWQNKPNTFNVAAHKRLRTMAAADTTGSGTSSQDCAICLNSIAPCQSLFVAPCSHTWHFKCVRSLLLSPGYPIFMCPNCRAGADLEADVEEPEEDWENLEVEKEAAVPTSETNSDGHPQSDTAMADSDQLGLQNGDAGDVTMAVNPDTPTSRPHLPHVASEPLPIRKTSGETRERGTPSPPGSGAEGPITPRNDAGPWVFDGGASGSTEIRPTRMRSLDAAADLGMNVDSQSEGSIK